MCLVPCLAPELVTYQQSLAASFENFASEFGDSVQFVIVRQPVQGAVKQAPTLFDHCFEIVLIDVEYRSVSRARNEGIEFALANGFSHVCFHDVSLVFSKAACRHFHGAYKELDRVFTVVPQFSTRPVDERPHACAGHVEIAGVSPLTNPYVWTYLIPVQMMRFIRFDVRFGPGDNTKYKAGEDLLFLYDVLSEKDISTIHCPHAPVWHRPRDGSYTKHLLYARGQGRSLRMVIQKHGHVREHVHALLFFANSLLRVLTLRPKSLRILKGRLIGFFELASN